MLIASDWKNYELLEVADGQKLERWNNYLLKRPDGQVIWPSLSHSSKWNAPDAIYHRNEKGGGEWEFKNTLPSRWQVDYKNLSFFVEPTGFKHTGLFPEQAINWDWMINKIKVSGRKDLKILNLFAYTGAASIACASVGAYVTHIDSSKGINQWAKENYNLNLNKNSLLPVRFITDDVKKFVQREIRRGNKYDGIIMDPPVYGRGPNGELWEIEKEISKLMENCIELLSSNALFLIVNAYTSNFSSTAINNLINVLIVSKLPGKVDSGEIGLLASVSNLILPCGIYGRWQSES